MTDDQKAAYVHAQAAAATIEALGMMSTNMAFFANGGRGPAPYTEDKFNALINAYGIHHNAVLGLFHD